MAIRLLGILISRRTDIIALTAFIIATGGIIAQTFYFLQGPKTSFLAPEQIVIVGARYKDGGEAYMRVIARMSYVNEGRPGYNDIIKKEMVSFQVGEKVYTHYWQAFVTSDSDNDNNLNINRKGDAAPVAVPAGNVHSHGTYFAPRHALYGNKYKNYLKWEEFKKNITKVQELIFVFSYECFSGEKQEVLCKINIDERFMKDLDLKKDKEPQWTVTSCIEVNKKAHN